MKLSQLFKAIPTRSLRLICDGRPTRTDIGAEGGVDPDIGSIHHRAQDVIPRGIFIALRGLAADGHDYTEEAISRGAVAVVTELPYGSLPVLAEQLDRPGTADQAICHIEVEDTRQALAMLSARLYDHPSDKLTVIGVTGTNGKTTTARIIEGILVSAGFSVGVIGTLSYRYKGNAYANPMTTPEAPELQKILSDMLNSGVTHVVMEVSSHGIDRRRIDGCHFDVGVFTNLTQDHLDYHGTMEAYWACKRKWFTDYLTVGPKRPHAAAVINCQHRFGIELNTLLAELPDPIRRITVGSTREGGGIRAEDVAFTIDGTSARLILPEGSIGVRSRLVGRYNLENTLCAAGAGVALNVSEAAIESGVASVESVSGRMEPVLNRRERFIYVDYAHTSDALERVLAALKDLAPGRIISVFGCGGNRDREKRPLMGRIALSYSDLTVITSDNPRMEDPLGIIGDICDGLSDISSHRYDPQDLVCGFGETGYAIQPDRREAIALSMAASEPGDTILIAGKGNETYQIIGNDRFPFDDREEARRSLIHIRPRASSFQAEGQ